MLGFRFGFGGGLDSARSNYDCLGGSWVVLSGLISKVAIIVNSYNPH